MKRYARWILGTLAFSLVLSEGGHGTATIQVQDNPNRVRFRITAIEEKKTASNIISEAVIEGPPGTDFNINLEGPRYKLKAGFLTDLTGPEAVSVRAVLDTRRLYGYSERNLPLYEQDVHKQVLQLTFEEAIVLLPFGESGDTGKFKIQIRPGVSNEKSYLATGESRPLKIEILKQSPGGTITIEALKRPHNFEAEIALLEDGREVAAATNALLFGEPREVTLRPAPGVLPHLSDGALTVRLAVNDYLRARPADQVALSYNLKVEGQESPSAGGAGVIDLGSPMKQPLGFEGLSAAGKKYELRFRVRLARGERPD